MRVITLEEHVATPAIQTAIGISPQRAPNEYLSNVLAKLLDMGEGRLREMDAAGIDVQVLSLAALGIEKLDRSTATSLFHDVNDAVFAAVQKHPDRLAGFANLNLKDPATAALELERCIDKLGFKGVLVNGTTDGKFLDDREFTPLFEAAQALDVPIYLHPAPPPKVVSDVYFTGLPGQSGTALSMAGWGWHAETALHVLRLILSGVFDRYPKLRMIIGHMGENLPFSLARSNAVLQRDAKHLQKSIAEYFHEHFWITTSGFFTVEPFLCTLSVVGADRILFSIDYPFSDLETGRAFLDRLPISPADRAKIAGGNAARLLKM